MNKILVWILIPLSLVCSWALWRCTQERNACRGELFIAMQRPSLWLRAEDFEQHGFTPTPSPTPTPPIGRISADGSYVSLMPEEKNYVYAKCASPEAIADMERKQIAVFNCKCEGDER